MGTYVRTYVGRGSLPRRRRRIVLKKPSAIVVAPRSRHVAAAQAAQCLSSHARIEVPMRDGCDATELTSTGCFLDTRFGIRTYVRTYVRTCVRTYPYKQARVGPSIACVPPSHAITSECNCSPNWFLLNVLRVGDWPNVVSSPMPPSHTDPYPSECRTARGSRSSLPLPFSKIQQQTHEL